MQIYAGHLDMPPPGTSGGKLGRPSSGESLALEAPRRTALIWRGGAEL